MIIEKLGWSKGQLMCDKNFHNSQTEIYRVDDN